MPDFQTLVVAFVVTQIATLVTTVYLHRTLAHRAVTLSAAPALVIRTVLWMTTGIKPREWVAVHRKHHAFSDEEGDPHSPLLEGFAMVQFGNVGLYREALRREDLVARYAKDLPPDRWDRWFFDHALFGLATGTTLLVLILGLGQGLVAAAVHALTYILLNAAINAIGHTFGRQPYPNLARNNQWLAWITAGEGLHNNHHAAPTAAKLALNRGEVDPGWWLISALRRFGWAKVRLSEQRVKERLAASG